MITSLQWPNAPNPTPHPTRSGADLSRPLHHGAGVQLQFIRPGRPVENTFVESFSGRVRDECLNQHRFLSLSDARRTIERWRQSYNEARPHSGLADLTPAEFVRSLSQAEEPDQPRLSA